MVSSKFFHKKKDHLLKKPWIIGILRIMFIRNVCRILKPLIKCGIFIALAILIAVILLVCIGMRKEEFSDYTLPTTKYESEKINTATKTILLWNGFFDNLTWYLPSHTLDPGFFEEKKCLHTNCLITRYHKLLPSVSFYDAVLFHAAEPFPTLNPVPSNRSAEQLYVFVALESPINTRHNLKDENYFYNLTMTYRLDSDILWRYGLIRDIETKAIIAPDLKPYWKNPPDNFIPDEALSKRIDGKTRKAAWFVSRCNVISNREILAKVIQENIGLDIYGKCGTLSCAQKSEECYGKLDKDYKFYLSFENSLCTDYVTEKLYYALEHNVVPIVYGGADYNRFAPPHSYINVEDFPTTSALVEYLKYVDSNRTEYNKYFWWKKYYEVSYETPFCQLCTILNNTAEREKRQTYNDIEKWWYGNKCNIKRKIVVD